MSDAYIVRLRIHPVNDPPTLEYIANQQINENTTLIIDIEASDVDGDELSFDYFIYSKDSSAETNPERSFSKSLLYLI